MLGIQSVSEYVLCRHFCYNLHVSIIINFCYRHCRERVWIQRDHSESTNISGPSSRILATFRRFLSCLLSLPRIHSVSRDLSFAHTIDVHAVAHYFVEIAIRRTEHY